MNKKPVVTAMALLLAGAVGVANADVKLYGQLDLSINRDDPAAGSLDDDDINMRSNTSAIGVKGSEDLGNGLSAFFKVEYQTNINDSDDDGWRGRDQYIGMELERWGKLTLGTMSTAYKSPGGKIDVAYRTSLESRGLGLQSRLHAGKGENGQGRSTNTARYDSPTLWGVRLYGTYSFDEAKDDPGGDDDDTYSVGLEYKGGNFFAAASYIDTRAQPSDTAAAQFLARYTWNNLQIHGIYELDDGLITAQNSAGLDAPGTVGGAEDDGADIWSIGAAYTIGNNVILADYGQGDDSDGSDGIANTADDVDDYDAWRIGAIHNLSNRTLVYAGYGKNDPDETSDLDRYSIGVRHKF